MLFFADMHVSHLISFDTTDMVSFDTNRFSSHPIYCLILVTSTKVSQKGSPPLPPLKN